MNYTTRTTATIILIATAIFSAPSVNRDGASLSATIAAPTVLSATPDEVAMVERAVARFAEAGLALPAISVTYHDTIDGCHGYLGHYDAAGFQLDMCNRGQSHIEPVNTLLHELVHAWSFEYLGESTQATFTNHRELDDWSTGLNWWLMGQEQAAEIVAWGLMDESFRSAYVNSESCTDLATAFEILTGIPPLHTNTDHCV